MFAISKSTALQEGWHFGIICGIRFVVFEYLSQVIVRLGLRPCLYRDSIPRRFKKREGKIGEIKLHVLRKKKKEDKLCQVGIKALASQSI